MAAVSISVEPGELQSLRALAELDGITNGRQPDVAGMAAALMRRALAAFVVFAAAGYLVPLHWTGFRGQTLWDSFGLLLLPTALVVAPMLPKDARSIRPARSGSSSSSPWDGPSPSSAATR